MSEHVGGGRPDAIRLARSPEFDQIRALVAAAQAARDSTVPLGDDAAVLELASGESVVVSTDIAVEDVHFRRAWTTWEVIGYRAVAAALSDLAAMAARPIGVLTSVVVPPELGEEILASIGAGMGQCLREHDGALLGGDTSGSPGPVVIDVTSIGGVHRAVRRDGAVPGDELWVTGTLGAAAAAVFDMSRSLEPDPPARRAFETPRPRLVEARWLAERVPLHAMIDLSDGLAGDAAHVAAASGVGLEIDLERVPLAPALESYPLPEMGLRLALTGGEDYELLFAAPPGCVEEARPDYESSFGTRLTRLGHVDSGAGVRWLETGARALPPGLGGFDHFARPDAVGRLGSRSEEG